MNRWYLFALVPFLGAGCTAMDVILPDDDVDEEAAVVLPVEGYVAQRTFKAFGEYISDRFVGYHVADDIEFTSVDEEVPVVAIADGTVTRVGDVDGYGGMILVDHGDINAIYGHVDLASVSIIEGDTVVKGQFLANLGDGETEETDGERKHLHFGLYEGEPVRVNGYANSTMAVYTWHNPQDWFRSQGVGMDTPSRTFTGDDRGSDIFHLEFSIPENMEVEYIPSIQSLNIFTLDGEGTARERSQFLVRYFDASTFLTLSTVTVHSTEALAAGVGDYDARRYDIEKKPGTADFTDQPSWRNERHVVTDFTAAEGYGRYYVVAANPDVDLAIYQGFLDSMQVIE